MSVRYVVGGPLASLAARKQSAKFQNTHPVSLLAMFNRHRKTGQSTAYTGVNHVAPANHQPNLGALAAALTIGQALKNPQQQVPRSPSIQYIRKPPSRQPSLLKRSPSLLSKGSFTISSIHQPPQFSHHHRLASTDGYDIDDTFDSQASVGSDNYAAMRDLKLAHRPPQQKVKTVKKYLPTPNGIKVIEVPEETFQQEVSRNNSIRSGNNIPRSPLFRKAPRTSSLNNVKKAPAKVPKTPKIEESANEDALARSDDFHEHEIKMANLQKHIEYEKALARDLELKRLEYEQLRLARLEKEKLLLEALKAEDSTAEPQPIRDLAEEPLSLNHDEPLSLNQDEPLSKSSLLSDSEEDVPITRVPPGVDELDQLHSPQSLGPGPSHESTLVKPVLDEVDSDEVPTINALDVVVDELEHNEEHDIISHYRDQTPDILNSLPEPLPETLDPKYETLSPEPVSGNSSVYDDQGDSLAKHLRPKFDPSPEIINDELPEPQLETLQLPATLNPAHSSGSSISSVDSSKKRPVKLAMKNLASFYASKPVAESNPAHQAYLLLTTAENTRLNSKLLSSQLSDINLLKGSHQYPTSPTSPYRRSQQFKKPLVSPSHSNNGNQNGNGLTARSLRPHSVHADAGQDRHNLSARTLRDRQSYVQPIAQHPTLSPNYQSPSKARAAELYAKANARPRLVFTPNLAKKLSYDKSHDQNGQPPRQTTPTRAHRTTLRGPPPAQEAEEAPQSARPAPVSRFADSDDEDGPSRLASRFADSDTELDHVPVRAHRAPPPAPVSPPVQKQHVVSLRPEKEKDKKEKPKKKKFLRKLFGRD